MIILLNNVFIEYDFESDEDCKDLLDDLRNYGQRFGKLVDVVIPRPNPDHLTPPPGVGKIFMEYEDLDAASRARTALNGMRLGLDNFIVAEYYPENMYAQGYLDA